MGAVGACSGAAYGLLSGNVASSCGTVGGGFLAVVPACFRPPLPRRSGAPDILTQRPSDPGRWAITAARRRGITRPSNVVQSKDRQPIWRAYDNLVIKLYKTRGRADARDGGCAISRRAFFPRLHSALQRPHRQTVGRFLLRGRLQVCNQSHRLARWVMTAVSATKDLKSCAATDDDLNNLKYWTPSVAPSPAAMQDALVPWANSRRPWRFKKISSTNIQGRKSIFIHRSGYSRVAARFCHDLNRMLGVPPCFELGHHPARPWGNGT